MSAQLRKVPTGGKAIVWADEHTFFAGTIEGRAGDLGGDGAFAEVSGKHKLTFNGIADLRAPQGNEGQLLLDPDALTIQASGSDSNLSTSGTDPLTYSQTTDADSVLLVSTLQTQLGFSAVILDTSVVDNANGTITVSDPVTWSSGNTLTFKEGNDININASLNGMGADIEFGLGYREKDFGTNTGDLTVASSATVTADKVVIKRNPDATVIGSNQGDGPIGTIDFKGILNVSTLDIQYDDAGDGSGGIDGKTIFDNASNQIGTLTSTVSSGSISDDFTVVDGSGGLIVDMDLSDVIGDVTLVTTGDLTLDSGVIVSTLDFSGTKNFDVVLAAQSGSFINNSGAAAVDAGGNGRFLIYSDDPANTTIGGLVGDPVYNKTYAANAPGTITQTGDRFLYSLAPVLTFTADNQTREYGDANSALTFSVTGLVTGDAQGDVFSGTPTLSTTITQSSNAGFYDDAITVAQGIVVLSDFDYQFAGVDGDFTINKVILDVTANSTSRDYGDANPTFTGVIDAADFKLGEDSSVLTTQATYSSVATPSSNVGTYDIVPGGGAATNYDFDYTNGSLTVEKATLNVTADDKTRQYGDANPILTGDIAGFKLGQTSAVLTAQPSYSTTAVQSSNSGDFDITPTGGSAANYDFNFINGTLTVDNALLTITADSQSRLYGGSNPTLTATPTLSDFKLGDDASVISGLSVTTPAATNSNVGDYDIIASGATATNYAITFVKGTMTINPAPLAITANNAASIFNDPLPEFTANFSGLIPGDTAADITGLVLSTDAVQGSNVGEFDIVSSGATNPNYDISFANGTLTISNQILTVIADDFSRFYGAANPTFTSTITGFVGSDDESVLTAPVTFATSAAANSPAATYTITPSNAAAPNYDIAFVDGTLTINPAPLTITALDASRLYGNANPFFGATFSGLVAGDTEGDINGLVLNTSAGLVSNVGDYDIVPSNASNSNYAITFVNGKLTVNKAPLTITADDLNREYGDPNPTFSTMFDGLKNGDTSAVVSGLTASTLADVNSDVGNYAITLSAGSATNYALTLVDGTLTVNKAMLTVTADDLIRTYGNVNPALTTTITGFKNGDTASVISGLDGSSTFSVVLAQYPLLRRRTLSTYFERYYRNV